MGPDQEEFGRQRLLAQVQRRLSWPAPRLFDELLAEIRQFAGGHPFEDDVCLVGVELAEKRNNSE
jgi:serine phosphatase RsbU (regulator of sigma subunit)